MGGLFSGTTKTKSTQEFDTGPSSFQQPYLDDTFGAAQSIYNDQKGTPAYQGDTYAGLSDAQKAQLANIQSYASGQGMDGANQISSIGSNLATAGTAGALSNLDRFTALAGQDPTQSNIAAATAYANNPAIDGQIDAASRDVSRNLYETQLPGIDRAASGLGGINSSRAGVASGIAQRGAADRVGDISSQIRGDAYNKGLDLASTDRAAQLAAYNTAAGSFANLGQQGTADIGAGSSLGYAAQDRETAANLQDQVDRQGGLDALKAKWDAGDTRASDLLARYNAIVGTTAFGSSGTSSGTGTSKQSGNLFGQLVGAGATLGSFLLPPPKS